MHATKHFGDIPLSLFIAGMKVQGANAVVLGRSKIVVCIKPYLMHDSKL